LFSGKKVLLPSNRKSVSNGRRRPDASSHGALWWTFTVSTAPAASSLGAELTQVSLLGEMASPSSEKRPLSMAIHQMAALLQLSQA
jgi:hypothetical protein